MQRQLHIPRANFSTELQTCLIIAEMFLAALCHHFVFTYHDYRGGTGKSKEQHTAHESVTHVGFWQAIRHTCNNEDTNAQLVRRIRASSCILSQPGLTGIYHIFRFVQQN